MNYAQVLQGMNAVNYRPVMTPSQTPASNLTVGVGARTSVSSSGPLVAVCLAVLGGLVLVYIGTRGIQGLK